MVKIYQQPFAHAGAKQVIPDSSDPQGFVSNEDGFTTDYELPDTDPNYKPIERAEFNGLMNTVTEAVGEIQQFGFAKWQPITWPQGARVVEGGVIYRALVQTAQKPPHADWANDSAVLVAGNQTVAGVKTFSSFPVTPSTAPTADYQVANKKYVDDMVEAPVKWVSGNKIITVANSGGDSTTVMGAIAEAMKWRSINGSVIVEIQSGYLVKEQLFFIDNDYSHINIKAQNGVTITVDHNSMSVTDFESLGASGFIVCARGKSPMFHAQFEFLTRPANTISGAVAIFNGQVSFGNNSGVKRSGSHGAASFMGGSITMGNSNNFSGAGGDGALGSNGGSVSMGNSNDFSGSGYNGAAGFHGGSVSMGDSNDFSGVIRDGAVGSQGGLISMGGNNNFSGAGHNGANVTNGGSITMGDSNNFSGAGRNGALGSNGGSVAMGNNNNFSGVGGGRYSFTVNINGFIQAGGGTIFAAGRERNQATGTITASGLIMG